MDKKTQLYVGIGAIVVIGYLLLKKKKPTIATIANYSGETLTDVVGRVQRADGIKRKTKTIYAPPIEKLQVTQGILSADGILPKQRTVYAPTKSFFDIKDSKFGG